MQPIAFEVLGPTLLGVFAPMDCIHSTFRFGGVDSCAERLRRPCLWFRIPQHWPMTDYRRNRVPGGTYFFTVNLLDRNSDLATRHVKALRDAVRRARARAAFRIDAWVVLPEHMHCVWTLPGGDADYSSRWRDIKAGFSKSLPHEERRSSSRIGKGERGIWQRRFWEHTIRDERDYAAHVDYVHFNPVKHGLVSEVRDWPFSSFHRHVEQGMYPAGWGGGPIDVAEAGERA